MMYFSGHLSTHEADPLECCDRCRRAWYDPRNVVLREKTVERAAREAKSKRDAFRKVSEKTRATRAAFKNRVRTIAIEVNKVEQKGNAGCRTLVGVAASAESSDSEKEFSRKDSVMDDDESCASSKAAAGPGGKGGSPTRPETIRDRQNVVCWDDWYVDAFLARCFVGDAAPRGHVSTRRSASAHPDIL